MLPQVKKCFTCMYVYTYVHIHAYTCTHIYMHTHSHTCAYRHIHTYKHTPMLILRMHDHIVSCLFTPNFYLILLLVNNFYLISSGCVKCEVRHSGLWLGATITLRSPSGKHYNGVVCDHSQQVDHAVSHPV